MKKGLLVSAIILMAQGAIAQLPNYVPASGLVGWWGFSGNSNDESSNLNDGVVNGASLTIDRFGTANSAYIFSGADDITVAHSTDFDVTSERSISLWVINPDLPTNGFGEYFMHKQQSSGATQLGFHMVFTDDSNTDKFFYRHHDGTNGVNPWGQVEEPFSTFSPSNWYHMVIVVTSTEMKLYIDGQLTYNLNEGSTLRPFGNNTSDLIIGDVWAGAGGHTGFSGSLDDIGFWNRALTECEIQDLYNAQLIDNNVTQSGAQLSADQSGATYQWLDCDNGNATIIGETSQSYTPTVTGNYAVEVTVNGCTVTSACVLVDFTGIEELTSPSKELIKVVDLMGREATPTDNTTLIYIYSDGTIERIFQTKID